MANKNDTTEILRWSGLMGHRFVVVEPTDDKLYGGWRTRCECNTLKDCHDTIREFGNNPKSRIFEQVGVRKGKRTWREHEHPNMTAARMHKKILGDFFGSL